MSHWFDKRFWSLPLASLTLFTAGGCQESAPAPEQHQTASVAAVAQALSSRGAVRTGGEQPGGTAGQAGPAITRLVGWRGKGPGSEELGREQVLLGDFAQRVERLVGENPFRFATRAGALPITRGLQPELDAALRSLSASDAPLTVLVMPSLPAQGLLEAHLRELGGKVVRLADRNVYVVKAPPAVLRRMSQDPLVYWIGQLPWDKKIDPLLARYVGLGGATLQAGEEASLEGGQAVIALHDPDDAATVRQALEALGVTITRYDADLAAFYGSGVDAGNVERLARMGEVSFIEARRLHHTDLETSVAYSGRLDIVRDNYSYGAGVTLGLIDTGIEIDHDAFKGWSPDPALYALGWNVSGEGAQWDDNPSGHGTHVAGIMLSRWHPYDLDGVAPRSGGDATHAFRVVRTGRNSDPHLFNVEQAMDLLASDNGAEVVNCSWSNGANTGTESSSIKADSVVWNKGQIYAFAAGNDGPGAGSIDSPAAAKNVIAVGSVDNVPSLPRSSFSSEGPTADGREKPDIYAVGGGVTSAYAGNLTYKTDMSGTSMATPHVTGFLATLLDHYPEVRRRPELAKAMLMASATRPGGVPMRTGLLNGYGAHFSTATTAGLWGWSTLDPLAYAYTYWDVTIPSGVTEMYVVLTWVEPPSAVGASRAVLDDVDLYVDYNRDGNGYGEWSSVSSQDNVEVVRVVSPPGGAYRIVARNFSASVTYRPAYALYYRL